jgi:DNA-binding response OmpR family regulator
MAVYCGGMDGRALLIVEDDEAIARGLVRVLDGQGYDVRRLARGAGAVRAAEPPVELVILDLSLPDSDGLDVCRRLREHRPELAILILTARNDELDIVAGLDAGANDYLTKPFGLSELLARIRSLLRHQPGLSHPEPDLLEVGAVRIDSLARRAWLAGVELTLRPKEFDLLVLLVANAGVALSRERIIDAVWETNWMGSTRTLDTHILTLRQKLGAGSITTLRGIGYRFESP